MISGDSVLLDKNKRDSLYASFNREYCAVDMESYATAFATQLLNAKTLILKIVVDDCSSLHRDWYACIRVFRLVVEEIKCP